MTENEFQEFIITMGYRYNEKTKTAFNSFEGFHVLIRFAEKESCYLVQMDCEPDGDGAADEVINNLRFFHEEHKEYVMKAALKRRMIVMEIRKTIDSDIDKEELRSMIHFLTEMCKSGNLAPLCRVCGRRRKSGVYIVGRVPMTVCDACIVRKRRLYEKRRDLFEKKKQSIPGGLIGAVFGAVLGALLNILLYQYVSLHGAGSVLVAVLCFAGFVVTGKRATKLSGVICALIAVVIFTVSQYAAEVLKTAIELEKEGYKIAVTASMDIVQQMLEDADRFYVFAQQIGIGTGVIILTGVAYFLKRKYTRPMKISKNLL